MRMDKEKIRNDKKLIFKRFDNLSIILQISTLLYIDANLKARSEGRLENVNDDELIKLIKLGDEDAAEELVRRYYSAILRYCKWHCSSLETAEDLTQETFLKLFRSMPQYKGKKKFKAYLYTIANHLCIDESRKISVYPLEDEENIVSERDEICQIEDREEVILRFGEQLSFAEIAKVTGCNLRTVQSRIRNALQIMGRQQDYRR